MKSKSPHKELKRVFNLYIRLRDCKDGYITCCDCGGSYLITNCDAGHFYPVSTSPALEFNERNVHGQYYKHNRNKGYNKATVEKIKIGYSNFMIKKYGAGIIDELKLIDINGRHLKTYEMIALIAEYKNKIKTLNNGK